MRDTMKSILCICLVVTMTGCGGSSFLFGGEACLPNATPVSLTHVGPQGFSGADMLDDAQARYGAFHVDWTGSPELSPTNDTFEMTFSDPTVEHRQAARCSGDDIFGAWEYLVVSVQASVQNADGTLVASLPLSLYAADLDMGGVRMAGVADVVAHGEYLDNLMVENVTGKMAIGFNAISIHGWEDRGIWEDGHQFLALERWYENDKTFANGVTYYCAHDSACLTPLR